MTKHKVKAARPTLSMKNGCTNLRLLQQKSNLVGGDNIIVRVVDACFCVIVLHNPNLFYQRPPIHKSQILFHHNVAVIPMGEYWVVGEKQWLNLKSIDNPARANYTKRFVRTGKESLARYFILPSTWDQLAGGKDWWLRATIEAIFLTFKNYFDVMRTNRGAVTFEIGKCM